MKPAALLALLLLSACQKAEITEQELAQERVASAISPWLYVDRETGCQYLTARGDKALTPRIDSDGKSHRGCKTPLLEK